MNPLALIVVLLIRLLVFTPYWGLGFLCYAYFVQDRIDWNSAWFWAYLLVWPLILFVKFAFWVALIVAIGVAVFFGGLYIVDRWQARQRRLRREKAMAERKAQRNALPGL